MGDTHLPPSTDWSETVGDDEAERHARFAEVITGIQQRVSAKEGEPGRAFHRKQIAGLKGRLEVFGGLVPASAQGLFARPGTYDAVVRMSNGGITTQPDAVPDIRGLAISVRGVSGPGALKPETDRQDFLLINHSTFGFTDTREFAAIVPLAARGQASLVRGLVAERGVVGGVATGAGLTASLAKWFNGFATSTFFSAAPMAWGPHAGKVRVRPQQSGFDPRAPLDWGADVRRRLSRGPLTWKVQVQLYVDEEHTPIEDGKVEWREDVSPWLNLGMLTVPRQDLESAEAQALASDIEAGVFDPWLALAEHRPLGEIMRARKVAYFARQRERGAG